MQTTLFHNTINLKGEELLRAKLVNSVQNAKILAFFVNHYPCSYTPFQVCDHVGGIITSVRRAITDLTRMGYLEKTGEMVKEKYGKANCKWRAVK